MTSLDDLKRWCDGSLTPPLPPPDERGLSCLALDRGLLLHVLANPAPPSPENDDIFVYLALANSAGAPTPTLEALFWQLNAWNLPGGLPAGMRIGIERASGLVWLSLRLAPEGLDARRFETVLQGFIATALRHWEALNALLTQKVWAAPELQEQRTDSSLEQILRSGGIFG